MTLKTPKSYEPIDPRPQRHAPAWTETGQQLIRLVTTDAQFEMPIVADTPHRGGRMLVAYRDGRGRWYEVSVLKSRVNWSASC